MYFILFYKTVDNYIELRAPYRDEHLAYAQQAYAAGTLLMAGALTDPDVEAVLVFKGESRKVAEKFAKHDPYVREGIVVSWKVRPWTVVIGNENDV